MVDLKKKVEVIWDHERVCDCCIHNGDCSGGVHGGPNGPIYPPCADCDPLVYMDTDLIVEFKCSRCQTTALRDFDECMRASPEYCRGLYDLKPRKIGKTVGSTTPCFALIVPKHMSVL